MLSTLGARSFSVAAPKLWNGLPVELCQETSLDCFKFILFYFHGDVIFKFLLNMQSTIDQNMEICAIKISKLLLLLSR